MSSRSSTLSALVALCLLSALSPFSPSTFSAAPTSAFRNPDLPVAERANDLISRLTTEEKISQLMMGSAAIPRLEIPAYDWWNEALHGVGRNGIATVYPQAIALAATWNPELHFRVADSISTEARAKNNEILRTSKTGDTKRYQGLTIWSPNINIFRDPRWGRGQETYGEDPLLTAELGVAFVRGLQGNDPHYLKTVATVKHFAVHSGPEPLRHRFNATANERDLRETYLPAFETTIREGRAMSLMSAYNAVNGIPVPASKLLLTDILRTEWGFDGAVVGDVDNVSDLWRPKTHEYAKDAAEASALAIRAGNELCSGKTYEALGDALKRSLITEPELDAALRRLFKLRFMLGQFDPPSRVAYRSIPISENDSPAHDALALEAARQSLVLLKNDGTLPLNPGKLSEKTVAILGPTGFEESTILGNYAGTPSRKITLADGIKTALEKRGIRVLAESAVPLVKGFRVTGDAIPDGVLFSDTARATPGLRAEIFSNEKQDPKNPTLLGKLAATQTHQQIDMQWDETQPAPEVPIANASLRWTGVMIPPATGEYTLGVVAEGAVRLFLDDKRVIDSWRREPERPLSATVTLNANQPYRIRIEYVQLSPKGRIQLGWIAPGNDDALDRAMTAARAADHIILTLGLTPDLEGESMSVTAEGFNGGDRLSIQLPETQRALLEKISALKKPTVLVLTGGSAIAFDDTAPNATLLAWYYGQRGADAVAEALLGETNPAGRLPVTFYKSDSDLPPFDDYAMANRTYKYFTGKPLYAFGHGLSYTTFEYQKLILSVGGRSSATPSSENGNEPIWNIARHSATAPQSSALQNDFITARITIKNTGSRDGDEVVQIYATAVNAPVPMPLRQLAGFARVSIKSGETKTIEISIPATRLRRWNEQEKRYVVDACAWQLAAGPSSDQPLLKVTLTTQQ